MIDYTTEMNKESLKKDTDLFDDYSLEPSLVEGNSDEEGVSVSEQNDYVKLVSEDDEDYEETDATQQRDKVLWIPYNSEEDIEDYQNNFSPKFAFNADATEAEVRIPKMTKTFSSRSWLQCGCEFSPLCSMLTTSIGKRPSYCSNFGHIYLEHFAEVCHLCLISVNVTG